jgi:hypothetical protein
VNILNIIKKSYIKKDGIKMKISCLTPTIRTAGLYLVKKALDRQMFKDFEWIICSPDKPKLIKDCKYDVTWLEDDFEGGVWSLNRAYNYMIKNARADLLVSWQDYTFANPDALQKYWDCYQSEPNTLVTGVGNKYTDESWTSMSWQDPRERRDQGTFYSCNPHDIEFNFCSIPKLALYDIGGFDEGMDFLGYGMDGCSVADRIDLLGGYDFKIDQTNKSYSLGHGRPVDWDEKNLLNGGYAKRMRELFDKDGFRVLNYLKRL